MTTSPAPVVAEGEHIGWRDATHRRRDDLDDQEIHPPLARKAMMIMNAKDLLVEMFDKMVVCKDASQIEHYYHPDFRLFTNGLTQGYDSFAEGHRTVYATEISYVIDYDDDAWVVTKDRVAGRVWITTVRPGEDPTEIEVMLVATVVEGRFHRLWELTWPDWSQLKAFESYETDETAGSDSSAGSS